MLDEAIEILRERSSQKKKNVEKNANEPTHINSIEVGALNAARCTRKASVNDILGQAYSLKDLGTLVRLERANTDLGEDLEQ